MNFAEQRIRYMRKYQRRQIARIVWNSYSAIRLNSHSIDMPGLIEYEVLFSIRLIAFPVLNEFGMCINAFMEHDAELRQILDKYMED